jgi:hypothetical protein
MHDSLEGFALAATVAAIALPGFPALAFVVWMLIKHHAQEQELKHEERLKALELGQTLPDAEIARLRASNEQLSAQVNAVNNRLGAVTCVALLVPFGLVGAAVGGTALVLSQAQPYLHLALICTAWGVCGIVSLASLVPLILVLVQRRGITMVDRESGAAGPIPEFRPTAIHEMP